MPIEQIRGADTMRVMLRSEIRDGNAAVCKWMRESTPIMGEPHKVVEGSLQRQSLTEMREMTRSGVDRARRKRWGSVCAREGII